MTDTTTANSTLTAPHATDPILVVDDNEADIELIRLAFKRADIRNELIAVRDGQEAVDYLAGAFAANGARRHTLPAFMMLDLNMPRMNGFDVLAWMARHPNSRKLPVVIFTSSSFEEDRTRAGELGADEYLVKPSKLSELVEMVSGLRQRWLDGAQTE